MQTLLFIDYIKQRVKRKPRNTVMADLLNDMERDIKNLEELGTFTKIYDHIWAQACGECLDVFKTFRTQYRRYCMRHDMLPEELHHVSL